MPIGEGHTAQITEALKQRYFQMIPEVEGVDWPQIQHEKNRLSRSLAAFAVEKLADTSSADAANAVLDAWGDNGIDAIMFDRPQNRLWVVQAKFGNAPDLGDSKKFCDGVRDLVAGRFEKFNNKFARVQRDVEEALETEQLKIVGCHAHLGDQLSGPVVADMTQLTNDLNKFAERFNWKNLNLQVIHAWLTAEHELAPLTVTLDLENWYGVSEPRRAFYGLAKASDLAALYQKHGKALFEKNIRHYLGAIAVNSAITATIRGRPAEFFFLNNGLTAVCSRINPAPGAKHESGSFTLHGFSVVNGAQTVGSIATARSMDGTVSQDGKVLMTLIEVADAQDNLGPEITKARNTQNAVRGLHFAALDPNQERLRRELAVSGIAYHYRPSAEALAGGPSIITLEKAALALACLSGSTKAIVAAKKEIGQLYERNGEIYPSLFRQSLSGVHLCRAVRIYDYLNGILFNSELTGGNYYRRMFFRHGRYFVLHILARRSRPLLDKPELELSEADKLDSSRLVLELAEIIFTVAEARFNHVIGYLAIFRNATDALPLAQDVMKRLTEMDAQKAEEAGQASTAGGLPATN